MVNGSADTNGDHHVNSGGVKFEVVSVRVVEEAGQKKHVVS